MLSETLLKSVAGFTPVITPLTSNYNNTGILHPIPDMLITDHKNNQYQKPEKTILVITECRSGSNYLCALMSKTGKLGNPQEYFSPHITFDNAVTIHDRCNIALAKGRSSNGIVTIKIFAHHLDAINDAQIRFSEIFQNRYWIWLRRQDLLEQAISRVIALQTEAWEGTSLQKKQPYYSSRQIIRALGYLSKSEARWRVFFVRNGITPLTLWYEEFISSPEDTIMKIAAYTGVDVMPSEVSTDVYTKIQRTELNQEWKQKFISEMADINYLDRLPALKSYPRTLNYFRKFIKGNLPSPD